MVDQQTLAAAIAIVKQIPDTAAYAATLAKQEAVAAAARAAESADKVTPATVADTKAYLGWT